MHQLLDTVIRLCEQLAGHLFEGREWQHHQVDHAEEHRAAAVEVLQHPCRAELSDLLEHSAGVQLFMRSHSGEVDLCAEYILQLGNSGLYCFKLLK